MTTLPWKEDAGMSEKLLSLGDTIACKTIYGAIITGQLETVLEKTVVIRDSSLDSHLVSQKWMKEQGFSLPEQRKISNKFGVMSNKNRGQRGMATIRDKSAKDYQ